MRQAAAIIVAGGTGSRFSREGGKQLAALLGKPVVAWTLSAVLEVDRISTIVVVCARERMDDFRQIADSMGRERVSVVAGGSTRGCSVRAGLEALPEPAEVVVVHDGARPLATAGLIGDALQRFDEAGLDGIVTGHPSVDTIKVVTGGMVTATPERSTLWAVQTPQVFDRAVLQVAHERALGDAFEGTDDASLVERIGGTVGVFEGPRDNIKITMPEDIAFAESVLAARFGKAD